jgi:arylsulfatase A-like enzyme
MRRIRTHHRRQLAAPAIAAAAVAAGMLLGGSAAHAGPAKQPNIVMVVTDDQRLDDFDARSMPATKRLVADEGTAFTDAIVTTPTCCPSRASMLTGQYGHNNGVTANAPGYRALENPESTLPVWLDEAGYQTAHLGKYLNGYAGVADPDTEVGPGWDEWYTMMTPRQYYGYSLGVNGKREQYGNKDGDYLTRVLNRQATHLVKRFAPKDDPFYIQLDQFAPHTESGKSQADVRCKGGSVPDPRDSGLFDNEKPPSGPGYNEKDVSDKPSFIRDRDRLDAKEKRQTAKRRGCRLASLRGVDRGVKKLVKTLKKEGQLDNTVIIFTSDNGYFLGEHRIAVNKTFPYEEAIRVPLAIRAPSEVIGRTQPAKSKRPVANIDLAPTILDLAGVEPCVYGSCRTMDGHSLVGILKGDNGDIPGDRSLMLEYGRPRDKDGLLCQYAGVRNTSHSYAEYTGLAANGGCKGIEEGELYDLSTDPFQLDNLFRDDSPSAVQKEMAHELNQLRECSGIAGRDPKPAGGSHCQ